MQDKLFCYLSFAKREVREILNTKQEKRLKKSQGSAKSGTVGISATDNFRKLRYTREIKHELVRVAQQVASEQTDIEVNLP